MSSTSTDVALLDDVHFRYLGRGAPVAAVRGVTLRVPPGAYLSIVGPSGAGKSTLLGLLGLLQTPTAGRVLIRGLDTSHMEDVDRSRIRRRTIGFVFQQFHLLPYLTAIENVEMALTRRGMPVQLRRSRACACLEEVGLLTRGHHRPNQLSGGEQQRVAIARAIAGKPALVLADEPAGNLDTASRNLVIRLLERLVDGGTALVMVTHDNEVALRSVNSIEYVDGRARRLR